MRVDSSEKDIYYSVSLSFVALTRLTVSFRYLTTGNGDAVGDLIIKLNLKIIKNFSNGIKKNSEINFKQIIHILQ